MTSGRVTAVVATVAVIAGGFWFHQRADAHAAPEFRIAAVERGDLQATVASTGTLGAVTTVQVGTQASGQIAAIYVDFNDRVRKGQLLARIDPTLQQQAVAEAEAGLQRARAHLELAQQEYERNRTLYEGQIVTAAEFAAVQSNYIVTQTNLRSAQISLDRARQNLAYTAIHAPIDGVVVERNVDVGQTVAASLSAPQLFLIANDLAQMQILASVDESDIGLITNGLPVRFSVQAYPNETFEGAVEQVRLQSRTQDNVVSYTAVIAARNPDGRLLPGMTATVQFVTGSATDALLVPNAALRFRPSAEMLASVERPAGDVRADSATRGRRVGGDFNARGTRAGGGTGGGGSAGTVWLLGENGKLTPARVRVGHTDGQLTVVQSPALSAGAQVVVGVGGATTPAAAASTTSPFQPAGGVRRGPGGGF